MDAAQALDELAAAAHDDLGRLLLRASREVNHAAVERLHERGFSDVRPAHAAVLAHLDADGTRIVDLAHRAGLTRQAVAVTVRELVAAGYADATADPADGRASLVSLTPRGATLCHTAAQVIRDEGARWGERIGDPGLTDLLARLRALVDAAG